MGGGTKPAFIAMADNGSDKLAFAFGERGFSTKQDVGELAV